MYSDYFLWLLDRIDALHGRYDNYVSLMQHLFNREYLYSFMMDENRAKAGENLRERFAMNEGIDIDDVLVGPCTILEVIEGISEEIAFNTEEPVSRWFWELIKNLDLLYFDDRHYDESEVDKRLDMWMKREYDSKGRPYSLFPLPPYVDRDARNMEMWQQMNTYMVTLYPAVIEH